MPHPLTKFKGCGFFQCLATKNKARFTTEKPAPLPNQQGCGTPKFLRGYPSASADSFARLKFPVNLIRHQPSLTPATHTLTLEGMEVHLTPDQQAFVRQAIESGRLQREEDAVKEALSLWEERERRRAEILSAVDEAEASLARGEGRIITQESMRELART